MINRAIHLLPAARDFGFEKLDAFAKLLDREGVEILPGELRGGIVVATGKIVRFHCSAASDAIRAKSSSLAR